MIRWFKRLFTASRMNIPSSKVTLKLPEPPRSRWFKRGILYDDRKRQWVLNKYPKLLHKPKLKHFTVKGQIVKMYKETVNEDDYHYKQKYLKEYESIVAYKIIHGIRIGYGDEAAANRIIHSSKPKQKELPPWPTKQHATVSTINEILKLRREHLIDNMLIICKDAKTQTNVKIEIEALYKTVSKKDPNYTYVQTHQIWVCTSTNTAQTWRTKRLFEKYGQTIIVNADNNFFRPYDFRRRFNNFSTIAIK